MQGLLTSGGGGGGSAMNPSMWIMMVMVGLGFAMSLSSLIVVGVYVIGGNGGTEGPAGPVGLQGATGATGPEGPQGEPGTSFIESVSNWLQLDGMVLEVGGLLSKSTALDMDSYDLVLSASGGGTMTVETPNVYLTGVQEDEDSSAPSVLVINNDSGGLVEYMSVSSFVNDDTAVPVVYTNGAPSGLSTRFSATYPATVQDNSLKLLTTVTYCAADGGWYTSNGVTYSSAIFSATRSSVGNHASMYRTTAQVLASSTSTIIQWSGTSSVQGPSICPAQEAGTAVTSFTLAPGGIYSVRATLQVSSSSSAGVCVMGAYLDDVLVTGSTTTIYTWGYSIAVGTPATSSELFTVVRVSGSASASLSIRTSSCTAVTGAPTYSAIAGSKVLIQQISIV